MPYDIELTGEKTGANLGPRLGLLAWSVCRGKRVWISCREKDRSGTEGKRGEDREARLFWSEMACTLVQASTCPLEVGPNVCRIICRAVMACALTKSSLPAV